MTTYQTAVAGAASIAVTSYGSYDTSYAGFMPNAEDATDNLETCRAWRTAQTRVVSQRDDPAMVDHSLAELTAFHERPTP